MAVIIFFLTMIARGFCLLAILFVVLPVHSYYVWPKPASISQGTGSVGVNAGALQITTTSTSKILGRAIQRYQNKLLFPMGAGESSTNPTIFSQLSISVVLDDDDLQFGVDESYNLTINSSSATSGTIQAKTVYGAMRGLETFSQLVDYSDNSTSYSINCLPTIISDTPRFPWRYFTFYVTQQLANT